MADLPAGPHPVVVLTRDAAIPVLTSVVCVVVTSTIRGHPAETLLGRDEGLSHDCAANCDDIITVPRRSLTRRRGHLRAPKLFELDQALKVALDLR